MEFIFTSFGYFKGERRIMCKDRWGWNRSPSVCVRGELFSFECIPISSGLVGCGGCEMSLRMFVRSGMKNI